MTLPEPAEPHFLTIAVAEAVHDRQLAEHGGLTGLRDRGLLAAAYAFGVTRDHPFIDGNKRTGWVLARLFLKLNRVEIVFDKADAVQAMLALAAGTRTEQELAGWFDARIIRR